MSGPLTWWANRKSRIGITPVAMKPPHLPGKEWWTTPPTAVPQPEHIEFVVQFMRELQTNHRGRETHVMLGRCSDWLRVARQLLHEQVESQRGDLRTTDGLLIVAAVWIGRLAGRCATAGLLTPEQQVEIDELKQALGARSARAKRERAIESAKTAAPCSVPRLRVNHR